MGDRPVRQFNWTRENLVRSVLIIILPITFQKPFEMETEGKLQPLKGQVASPVFFVLLFWSVFFLSSWRSNVLVRLPRHAYSPNPLKTITAYGIFNRNVYRGEISLMHFPKLILFFDLPFWNSDIQFCGNIKMLRTIIKKITWFTATKHLLRKKT